MCVDLFTLLRGFTESLLNTEEESRFKKWDHPFGLTAVRRSNSSVIHHIARHSQAGENTISRHDCELRTLRFFGPSTRDEKSRYIGLCCFHLNTLVLICLSRVSRHHWSTELNLLSGPFTSVSHPHQLVPLIWLIYLRFKFVQSKLELKQLLKKNNKKWSSCSPKTISSNSKQSINCCHCVHCFLEN